MPVRVLKAALLRKHREVTSAAVPSTSEALGASRRCNSWHDRGKTHHDDLESGSLPRCPTYDRWQPQQKQSKGDYDSGNSSPTCCSACRLGSDREGDSATQTNSRGRKARRKQQQQLAKTEKDFIGGLKVRQTHAYSRDAKACNSKENVSKDDLMELVSLEEVSELTMKVCSSMVSLLRLDRQIAGETASVGSLNHRTGARRGGEREGGRGERENADRSESAYTCKSPLALPCAGLRRTRLCPPLQGTSSSSNTTLVGTCSTTALTSRMSAWNESRIHIGRARGSIFLDALNVYKFTDASADDRLTLQRILVDSEARAIFSGSKSEPSAVIKLIFWAREQQTQWRSVRHVTLLSVDRAFLSPSSVESAIATSKLPSQLQRRSSDSPSLPDKTAPAKSSYTARASSSSGTKTASQYELRMESLADCRWSTSSHTTLSSARSELSSSSWEESSFNESFGEVSQSSLNSYSSRDSCGSVVRKVKLTSLDTLWANRSASRRIPSTASITNEDPNGDELLRCFTPNESTLLTSPRCPAARSLSPAPPFGSALETEKKCLTRAQASASGDTEGTDLGGKTNGFQHHIMASSSFPGGQLGNVKPLPLGGLLETPRAGCLLHKAQQDFMQRIDNLKSPLSNSSASTLSNTPPCGQPSSSGTQNNRTESYFPVERNYAEMTTG